MPFSGWWFLVVGCPKRQGWREITARVFHFIVISLLSFPQTKWSIRFSNLYVFMDLFFFFCFNFVTLYSLKDLNALKDDLMELKPTFLAGVPRVFERIREGMEVFYSHWLFNTNCN